MAGGGSSELRLLAERIATLEAELEALKRRVATLERKTESTKTEYGTRKNGKRKE